MAQTSSSRQLSAGRLILFPATITLAVTLLRLAGELRHWPRPWFDFANGIVGITWLPPIFGAYFALRLWGAGERPRNIAVAFALALLGLAFMLSFLYLVFEFLPISFFSKLLILWTVAALSAAMQFPAWPAIFKTLIAYGFAARLPVAVVMFLAMRGRWGTHYDSGPPTMNFWARYVWFAFFAQLVYWVGFTIVTGSLGGSIAALARRRRSAPQEMT